QYTECPLCGTDMCNICVEENGYYVCPKCIESLKNWNNIQIKNIINDIKEKTNNDMESEEFWKEWEKLFGLPKSKSVEDIYTYWEKILNKKLIRKLAKINISIENDH
ncbi:MAG: hypothetical protein ACTSRP_16550, partial [Candidatus Helarchaeota archaeon]